MHAIEWTHELRFLVALAIGFLIGLERESTKAEHKSLYLGGVRTFPIVSMLGFGCAWLYEQGATFMLPVGLLAIGALTAIAYYDKIRGGRHGATSEIALILTYAVGALALLVDVWIAMALGIVTTMLLSEKAELETWVESLDRVGFLATLRFLLVTVIILPVLPDQEYTRFKLNPARLWQIVILVSSVGYVGYLLSKRFGKKASLWMTGLLGGVVSSTAATISFGRLAQRSPERSAEALRAGIFAASMMYPRILVLVWLISPAAALLLWWKLLILSGVGLVLAFSIREPAGISRKDETSDLRNPFEMRPALLFAMLFVGLSVLTTYVVGLWGEGGTKFLAIVVGVADVDPFILSVVQNTQVTSALASSAVILAAMSNTIAKGTYFGGLASANRKETAMRYGIWAMLHLLFVS